MSKSNHIGFVTMQTYACVAATWALGANMALNMLPEEYANSPMMHLLVGGVMAYPALYLGSVADGAINTLKLFRNKQATVSEQNQDATKSDAPTPK